MKIEAVQVRLSASEMQAWNPAQICTRAYERVRQDLPIGKYLIQDFTFIEADLVEVRLWEVE